MKILKTVLKAKFLIIFLYVANILSTATAQTAYFDVIEEKTINSFKEAGLSFNPESTEFLKDNNYFQTINYDYMVFNKNCYDTLKTMPADIFDQYAAPDFFQSFEFGVIVGVISGIAIVYAYNEVTK